MLYLDKFKNNIYLIFLALPIIFSFLWHNNNTQIPVSDAIGWLEASVYILEPYWNSNSITGTLYELFSERSWRPVIFHIFVVPFLWLTDGDFLLTTLFVHVLFVSLSTFIIYKIFKLRLDNLSAAISTSIVCLSTNIMFGGIGLPLFSELSFTPFFLCTIYFLIKSDYFKDKKYSIFFSIFFFLLFATRPVEAIIYMSLPLLFFFYKSISEKRISLISVVKSVLLSFSVVSILCISRFIPNPSNTIRSIDPPHSLEIFTIFSLVLIFLTLLILLYYLYLRNKENKNSNYNDYLFFSFKVHTSLIFIWWYSHFSNLYEWVYQTSIGSVVSYYAVSDISWLIVWAFKSFGIFIFPIILIIFIIVKFSNYLKKINDKFYEEYYYLLLTIPFPWILYLFSVQGFYRKVSLSLVCLLIFFLLYIMNKKPFLKTKKIILSLLVSFQLASLFSHTFIQGSNDQFWAKHHRNNIASGFIGIEYPIPVNIHPNYHNIVVNFIKNHGKNNSKNEYAIVVEESGEPVDAFVLSLLCRKNNFSCRLPYKARSKLLSKKYVDKNILSKDFKLLLNDFIGTYDSFFLINPKTTFMRVTEEEAKKALDFSMHSQNISPSARFAYYLKYLYSSNKLTEYNLILGECVNINKKYDGCFINHKAQD